MDLSADAEPYQPKSPIEVKHFSVHMRYALRVLRVPLPYHDDTRYTQQIL